LFFAMSCQRVLPLIMAVPLFFGAGGYFAVGVFLALFGTFWMMDGIITMPWSELVARAIKPDLRGHMMGMQVAIGSCFSLLTGLLLAWLLATPTLTDHYRFGYIFILTSAVLLLSIIFISLVRDPQPIKVPEKADVKKYYAMIPKLIKASKPLQRILIARMPAYIGFSVITFMVVFSANVMEVSDTQVSWLVYSQIVGGLISGILLGEISRRFGNKTIIMLCNVGVLLVIALAITLFYLPAFSYFFLIVLCAFASLWLNNWFGYMNYIIDISPKDNRPAYQLIGNCIGIPFSFVGYGIGAIIDKWGYAIAFVIGGVAAITAVVASSRLLSKKQIAQREEPASP